MLRRKTFRVPRLTMVEVVILIAICMIVISGAYGLTHMALNDCEGGFWIRDAMGIPRCIQNQNVNILVH